jgi:hypothetical protein
VLGSLSEEVSDVRLAFVFLEGVDITVELVDHPHFRCRSILVDDVGEGAGLVCAYSVQGPSYEAIEIGLVALKKLESDYQCEGPRGLVRHAVRLSVALLLKSATV